MAMRTRARDWLAAALRTARFKGRWRIAQCLNRLYAGSDPEPGKVYLPEVGWVQPDLRDVDMLAYLYWIGLSNMDRAAIALLSRAFGPNSVFVDVGANVGVYTLALARSMPVGGRVVCFEPNPLNYRRLQEHIALNGLSNVTTENVGVSDRPGRLEVAGADHPGNWTLKTGGPNRFVVTLTTLDTYFESHPVGRISAIKLDIEGAEAGALRGAKATIERHRPTLLFELNPDLLEVMGSGVDDLLDLVEGFRYEVFELPLRRSHELKPILRSRLYRVDFTNLVALPAERRGVVAANGA